MESFLGLPMVNIRREKGIPSGVNIIIDWLRKRSLKNSLSKRRGTKSRKGQNKLVCKEGVKIKAIAAQLGQHGSISESNVYNWFQNRRARTKRKQQAGGVNNAESEFDTDVDSQEEKKPRMDRDLSHDSLGAGHYATNSQNEGGYCFMRKDHQRKENQI